MTYSGTNYTFQSYATSTYGGVYPNYGASLWAGGSYFSFPEERPRMKDVSERIKEKLNGNG